MAENKNSISVSKQNIVTFTENSESLTLRVTPMSSGTLMTAMTDSVVQNYIYPGTPLELGKLASEQRVLDKIIPLSEPVLSGFSKEDAISNLDELFRKVDLLPYIKIKGLLVEMINEGDITTQEDYNYYVDSCIDFNHYDMPKELISQIKNSGIGNQSDLVKATAQVLVDMVAKLNKKQMFDLYSQDSTTINNQAQ